MRKLKRNPNFTKIYINTRFEYSRILLNLIREYNSQLYIYEKFLSQEENNLATKVSENIENLIDRLRESE